MNSAAVIGRQLRQQQNSNRISGPVVPPTHYRGRGQSSNVFKIDRDLLSVPVGPDADKKFTQFSQQYAHEFYPHPAHREKNDKSKVCKEKKKHEDRIRCTWHCFCVALKALSSGIILLTIGTTMSIVGFFADSLSMEQVRLSNGTVVSSVNADVKTHLHNLTYVGPVIMGLGGIVVVAACVLTFEVRDTLGVKENPSNEEKPSPVLKHTDLEIPFNHLSPPENTNKQNKETNGKTITLHKDLPSVAYTAGSDISTLNGAQSTTKMPERREYLLDCDKLNRNKNVTLNGSEAICSNSNVSLSIGRRKLSNEKLLTNLPINPCHASDEHLLWSNSSELSYFRIPSPQETELSDPEGCSLNVALSKWKSRCSCSGSPTNSMLSALHYIEELQGSPHCARVKRQHKNSIPFVSQLPNRYSKILASIESDGLSSMSFVSEDSACQPPQAEINDTAGRGDSGQSTGRSTTDLIHGASTAYLTPSNCQLPNNTLYKSQIPINSVSLYVHPDNAHSFHKSRFSSNGSRSASTSTKRHCSTQPYPLLTMSTEQTSPNLTRH